MMCVLCYYYSQAVDKDRWLSHVRWQGKANCTTLVALCITFRSRVHVRHSPKGMIAAIMMYCKSMSLKDDQVLYGVIHSMRPNKVCLLPE